MKITIKNVTNMTACSNIPEGDNKITLTFSKLNNIWSSGNIGGISSLFYIITTQSINEEFTEIKIKIVLQPLGPGLNVINGIKLDNEWVSDDRYSYYSKSTNVFFNK